MPPELIVAADKMYLSNIVNMAWDIKDRGIWGIKLNDSLINSGTYAIDQLYNVGVRVMADPKLNDIPQTMLNCIEWLERHNADMITIHISSGTRALLECRRAAKKAKLFGITVLTSMSDAEVEDLYGKPRLAVVENFMNMARLAGLDGVVCAADCLPIAKNKGLQTIVPGVRLPELGVVTNDDQVHMAVEIPQSDFIVVGRPITQAANYGMAVEKVRALLEKQHAVAGTA